MWNELGENIQGSLEIGGVPVGQANSKSHVDNSKNNGHLVLDDIQDLNFMLDIKTKAAEGQELVCCKKRQKIVPDQLLVWEVGDL